MWFAKQGPALAYHDAHPAHIILAKDISSHGHKKYGIVDRGSLDQFVGPFNELIRTHAVCKLYFDLDGGPEHLPGDDIVRDLLLEVCEKLREVYKIHVEASDVIVHKVLHMRPIVLEFYGEDDVF